MGSEVLSGDCLTVLRTLPERSCQVCITSPPYYGLRDYGADGQIGLEDSPERYVERLVEVFREVRRVLRDDGTLWVNLGDSYAGSRGGPQGESGEMAGRSVTLNRIGRERGVTRLGAKPKDLLGIPWMVAFALRADGWYLRSDVIWAKPNPMPESVSDRPTKAHEYLFLLSKSPSYYYDADAIREDAKDWSTSGPSTGIANTAKRYGAGNGGNGGLSALAERYKRSRAESEYMAPTGERHSRVANGGRNKRSVWQVATQPFSEAHFATYPPALIEPCVLAGSASRACSACGAPWERITERTPMVIERSERALVQGDGVNDRRTATSGTMTEPPRVRTVGWEASCSHGDGEGRSLVLDPFCGSGTTGVVAEWYGRDFLGIELNPEYAEMARNRIAAEGRLGRRAYRPERPSEDQMSLLGAEAS